MKKYLFTSISCVLSILVSFGVSAQVEFTNYTSAQGLMDDYVTGGLAIDDNGVKWFGTQNGLSKYNDTEWQSFDLDDGLINNYIQCIAVDNSSNIWIGTENGVSKFDGTVFTNFTTVDGLSENSILDIACDNSGNIWFASFSGLTKYNGTSFQNFTTTDGMSSDLISCITVSGSKLYIGTFGAGLMIYNGVAFTTLTTDNGLQDNNISAIALDSNGKIWVGSYYGITVLNPDNSVSTSYTLSNGLINNYVQDIAIDDNDNVIVCEYADYLQDGGISMLTGTSWTNYKVVEGLVNVMTKRVVFDEENFAWITTGGGVSKMDTDAGFPTLEISQFSIYPNPVYDLLYLPEFKQTYSYYITDMSGRIIEQKSDCIDRAIDIINFSTGVYFISFVFDNATVSLKFIKE
ncbi:MAG TPA: two-component regulator propeller domain-containing protein [Bacteroidales bacterium]|nr:two-component regulator propeller domain-containing protein [Bacteroidales bacterium]